MMNFCRKNRSSFEGGLFHGPKNVLSKDATILEILEGFTFRSPAVKKEIILTGFLLLGKPFAIPSDSYPNSPL